MFRKESKSEGLAEIWMKSMVELIGFIDDVLGVKSKLFEVERIGAEDFFESHWNNTLFHHFCSWIVNDNGRNKAHYDLKILI